MKMYSFNDNMDKKYNFIICERGYGKKYFEKTNLEKIRKQKRINKKRTFKRIRNKCKNN